MKEIMLLKKRKLDDSIKLYDICESKLSEGIYSKVNDENILDKSSIALVVKDNIYGSKNLAKVIIIKQRGDEGFVIPYYQIDKKETFIVDKRNFDKIFCKNKKEFIIKKELTLVSSKYDYIERLFKGRVINMAQDKLKINPEIWENN